MALLKLMHLVSPALPIGAYAYSQGQEWAVDAGWVSTAEEVETWIQGVLFNSLVQLDLPVLQRMLHCWQHADSPALEYWNNYLLACRETHELLLEDQQLGMALGRLLVSLEITDHQPMFNGEPSFVSLFALAGWRWQIPEASLMQGFCWSWIENQVAAATKTVPLGQTQAQQILQRLMQHIPAVVKRAQAIADDDIGLGMPGVAIASSLHERQYSRLFRS